MFALKINQNIPMTRRYPILPAKKLKRDSIIVTKLMSAWDKDHDQAKVLAIFLKEQELLSDQRYWELLRTTWIICGSNETAPIFRKLFESPRKHRGYFSYPEEYAYHYKEMFSKNIIAQKIISRNEIFAYINRNNESEVILL